MGSCFIVASEELNTSVASKMEVEKKDQIMKPAAIKGKNSLRGVPKILPKINPMVEIMTAVEIVIQKGPSVDLLYLCLISYFANRSGSRISFSERITSIIPLLVT